MAALRKAGPTRPIGRPRKYTANADRQRAYRQRLKRSVYFRSTTGLWSTPQAFFDVLDAEFHFTTDVCALPENAKCTHYYTPEQDGLRQEWAGVCFMNAPYGLPLRQWVAKAYASAQAGVLVVCLLPVRTDTQWWHAYVLPYATEVRYLKGRLTFGGACHTAPFPLAVVIFKPPINGSSGEVDALGDICACADMTRDATITAITQSTSQFPGSSALLVRAT